MLAVFHTHRVLNHRIELNWTVRVSSLSYFPSSSSLYPDITVLFDWAYKNKLLTTSPSSLTPPLPTSLYHTPTSTQLSPSLPPLPLSPPSYLLPSLSLSLFLPPSLPLSLSLSPPLSLSLCELPTTLPPSAAEPFNWRSCLPYQKKKEEEKKEHRLHTLKSWETRDTTVERFSWHTWSPSLASMYDLQQDTNKFYHTHTPVYGITMGFQARSRGGRWNWTLKLAQKRSWAGRWSWAAKVGLLSLRVVPQQQCNGQRPCDSAQARQLKQQLRGAPVAGQRRGDTALTLPLFWQRSTVSQVFLERYPQSSLHSFIPFPPVPIPNKQPRFCGRKTTWSIKN